MAENHHVDIEETRRLRLLARDSIEREALKPYNEDSAAYLRESGHFRLLVSDDGTAFMAVVCETNGMLNIFYTDEALYDLGYQGDDGHYALPPEADDYIQMSYVDRGMAAGLLPLLMKLAGPLESILAATED